MIDFQDSLEHSGPLQVEQVQIIAVAPGRPAPSGLVRNWLQIEAKSNSQSQPIFLVMVYLGENTRLPSPDSDCLVAYREEELSGDWVEAVSGEGFSGSTAYVIQSFSCSLRYDARYASES